MKRIALLVIVAACGRHDEPKNAAPAPAPAPAPDAKIVAVAPAAPPDAPPIADELIGDMGRHDPLPRGDLVPPDRSRDGSRNDTGPMPPPQAPRGRLTITEKQSFDETTLTDDMVLVKVQQVYYAGMKRCYADGLKVDPTMRGKLVLKFTVLADGKTAKIVADGFDAAIDACLQGRAQAWRFAVPKDKNGEATEAAFQLTFQLVPD